MIRMNGAKSQSSTRRRCAQLDDREFYDDFCLPPADDGVAEFWRSGGSTGAPLFYPRSYDDIVAAMTGFARVYDCTGCRRGGRAHLSFPLGIHPVGQMLARAAAAAGIAVNWAGSGTTTPSALQLELIGRLQPTIWMGMSSYGLHLANLAEARGLDLGARSVETLIVLGGARVGCKTRQTRPPLGRAGARHLWHDRSRNDGCRRRGRPRLPHLDGHVLYRGA